MGHHEVVGLLRDIRDLVQVLVIRQAPELLELLRERPSTSRPSKRWACGQSPEDVSEMDADGQT